MRVIGVIEATQRGKKKKIERNDRLIAVAASSHRHKRVKRLKDLLHAKREEYDPLSVRMIYAGKELRDGELVRATSVT